MPVEREESAVELGGAVTLPNWKRLRIRALRPREDGPIRELYAHLSPRTRYLRFFSAMPVLPESVIRLLVGVDNRRQIALVAEQEECGGGQVIGLASLAAIDQSSAEVGLVVRDDWQQQQVGTELASRLLQAAEHRGFHRFVCHVLWGNDAIRRLLKNVAVVVSTRVSGGVSELAFVRRSPTVIAREALGRCGARD